MKDPRQDDIELIERYFDNALTGEEAHGLKDRLVTDPEFKKLFNREKTLVSAIRLEGARGDLDFLKGIEASMSKKDTGRSFKPWYYLAAACITVFALLVWMPWKTQEPRTLYAEYFEPHANIFEPTLRGETSTGPRARAFQAYEQKDYARAAELFTTLLQDNRDAGMLMLLGNANLMLGETAKAKENFRSLIDESDDLDTAGKWYLSLSHLRDGETDVAANLLREIDSSQSPYAQKARDLLRDLDL